MKFLFVVLFFATLVMMIHSACIGRPRHPSCSEDADEGYEQPGSVGRRMWYYNKESGSCEQMQYKGAGGNDNRWCSKGDCDHHCTY